MEEIPIRTCIGCQHFVMEIEGDWSDLTPGDGFKMYCMENVYQISGNNVTRSEFEQALMNAETCGKFTKRK